LLILLATLPPTPALRHGLYQHSIQTGTIDTADEAVASADIGDTDAITQFYAGQRSRGA
jgi:hypothetical protein